MGILCFGSVPRSSGARTDGQSVKHSPLVPMDSDAFFKIEMKNRHIIPNNPSM